jgi:membrane-associated protein
MHQILDYFLHLQDHLEQFVALYGPWVYGLLFLIIFCETGLVVTPFLPGDSLLFATGALAASTDSLDVWLAAVLLSVAAILGDAVNYAIGIYIGPRVFRAEDRTSFWRRLLNRDHLMQAHAFFERHGGKAIVLGRFVPIIRTFVPFVAGAGSMSYPHFAFYNITGALLWVGLCIGAGYAFGNVPIVKDNFEIVLIGIIAVSVAPIAWGYLSERRKKKQAAAELAG